MGAKKNAVLFFIILSYASAGQTPKNSPVLEFRPLPEKRESTLIWIDSNSTNLSRYWRDSLDFFLEQYISVRVNRNDSLTQCNNEPPRENQVCHVDIREFRNCSRENRFGYERGSPCIFLRLGDIPKNWLPEVYNVSTVPKEMPQFIKYRVRQDTERGMRDTVWVSCDGEYPADKEFIGPVSYYPRPGFPANYFRAAGRKSFLSPLVAVQFERPSRGVLINVLCTAWAANIPRGVEDKLGTVHFELMID